MEQLIACGILWTAVFIIIPVERIKELSPAIAVAILWMIFVDNAAAYLNFYRYQHSLISIGRASFFQLLVCAAVGVLMINWLREEAVTKILSILVVAVAFVIVQQIYAQTGAFSYGNFDMMISFVFHIVALIIFLWLSLTFIGEETVYHGNRVRKREG